MSANALDPAKPSRPSRARVSATLTPGSAAQLAPSSSTLAPSTADTDDPDGTKSKRQAYKPPPSKEEQEKKRKAALKKKLEKDRKMKLLAETAKEKEREQQEIAGLQACFKESSEYEADLVREKAEEGRRIQESEETTKWEELPIAKYEQWKRKKATERDWIQYLNCTRRVNPTKEAEVNTFISLWRDQEHLDLAATLALAQEAEDIIADGDYFSFLDGPGQANLQKVREMLRSFSLLKVDEVTANVIQHADMYAAEKADSCKVSQRTAAIDVGIWVNFSKSPSAVGNLGQIDFQNLNIVAEVPGNLAMTNTAIRIMRTLFDEVTPESSEHVTIGGILYYELLGLPPLPKKIKNWTLRPVTLQSRNITRLAYAPPNAGAKGDKVQDSYMLKVTFYLPKYVLVRSKTIAWWNKEKVSWQTDGIGDVHHDPITRALTFHTLHTTPHALIQSRFMELPYRWWALCPSGYGRALLTILTKTLLEICIEISDESCRLVGPGIVEFEDLRGQWLPVSLLLKKLGASGVHLRGSYDTTASDTLLTSVLKKDEYVESHVYRELSKMVSGFAFSWSKWNNHAGPKKAIFLTKEASNWEPITFCSSTPTDIPSEEEPRAQSADNTQLQTQGDGWKTVLFHEKTCVLVASSETSSKYTGTLLPNAKFHERLFHCLKECSEDMSSPGWQRVLSGTEQFARSVQLVLDTIRPLSFGR